MDAIWEPTAASGAAIGELGAVLGTRLGRTITTGPALADAAVAHPAAFWETVWDLGVRTGVRGERSVLPAPDPRDVAFFPDARLNLAEHLLSGRNAPGATALAMVAVDERGRREELRWDELEARVAAMAVAMRADGVSPGDRVAAWVPNGSTALVTMLAATSLGAVFSSTSPDFGVGGVLDRFGQIEPTVVVMVDGYHYGGGRFVLAERLAEVAAALPSVRRFVVDGFLDDAAALDDAVSAVSAAAGADRVTSLASWVEPHGDASLDFEQVPFDHPCYVLYSSGTTGVPKAIVHRVGGMVLKHLTEHRLHCDVAGGDRVFYFSTCGWMMWNWLVSALGVGATVVAFDGNPFHPGPEALFDLAQRERVTLFGVSAKFLDAAAKAGVDPSSSHDLSSIRTVCSTGSPLSPEGFTYVAERVAPGAHIASISGGTDLCGCLVAGDPTQPVRPGEIQITGFGLDTQVWADDGTEMGPDDGTGELVCVNAFPSMPLGFWGDDDGSRYRAAYWERFPGVWTHGDWASRTPSGGFVIHGRSDATLNPGGVRIGTAEIYRQVESFDAVAEAVAVGQPWDGDTRIVLFVRPTEGHHLTEDLVASIRSRIRSECSPRHVPAVVAEVADIPRTRSGKIAELAVADVIAGRPVRNTEALANPESLALFADRPELA